MQIHPVSGVSWLGTFSPAVDTQALIRKANQHYQRALQLQRQGDWAGYGGEVKKLGEVLNRLASTPQAAGNK